MVVLTKIYTKTGDDGTTALGSGERVLKTSARIAAYGTVDETNAVIGMARSLLPEDQAAVAGMLSRIQNDLFDLGADLCVPDKGEQLPYTPLRLQNAQVERLEHEIDAMNGEMAPLTSFVLPGGSQAGAALHLARTICRRAERCIVELKLTEGEQVSDTVCRYINRLSDH
ncbi:MAG: cob(I)yrinic acid a,c-diamide adenosyltransferase, partial [Rhodomicrobium sp.]|nr:cob(I)yrinic acid a,c-diamide adenosyltransferase [Rhodomicrobium sp.]